MWTKPTEILSSLGVGDSVGQGTDNFQWVSSGGDTREDCEKSLSLFAEKIASYRNTDDKCVSKGRIFEFKVIDEL